VSLELHSTEGLVFDSLINYLDKFGPEILVLQFGFLIILFTIFLWLWFSNRRKYNNLKHAIPANVVKSYLDSIIQNSTSLKSQLFRGGGTDVGTSIPSVMPLQNLMGGEGLALSGAPSTALLEELNQKKAQVAALEAQLVASQNSHRELEAKITASQNNLIAAEKKIKELEALLAQSREAGSSSGAGNDAALKAELTMVSKERDELRERLREFEIISDDLANLKRLQQENEQLKRSLGAQQEVAPSASAGEVAKPILDQAEVSDLFEDLGQNTSEDTSNSAMDDFLANPAEDEASTTVSETSALEEDLMATLGQETPNDEDKAKSERTSEDLLSEFEKMLG
jgi:hypothetical protein